MYRSVRSTTALTGALVTVLSVLALPAGAACTTDGTTMTCTGDDIPYVYKPDGSVTDITYKDVTKSISADLSANHSYALNLEDNGDEGHDATKDDHEDGQDGGDGGDGGDLSSTMHFDDGGSGMDSDASGIRLVSEGGVGGEANEDSAFGTAHGGVGGTGGNGGTLTVLVDAGDSSDAGYVFKTTDGPGVKAVSEGGDGGKGGKGTNQSGFHQGDGGEGGEGGKGGDVTVTLTDGDPFEIKSSDSAGLTLLSSGGDGAEAGEGLSDNTATGGRGGAGGDGGDVTLLAQGGKKSISTTGTSVHGILAISEAGNGGEGGEGHGPDDGIGGNGGHGGTGGNVSITYEGDITTTGDTAVGVLIQSLGGAGGEGGPGKSWFDGNGGHANEPGPGGDASVDLKSGTITTSGEQAVGILIESVGGFAGSSGESDGFVAYGANGESGGDGGTVSATLEDYSIDTAGDYAVGLIAASIGGGGGTGSKDEGFDAIGATGGAGGAGGKVEVTLTGTNSITTKGEDAPGILAMSAGGGGGVSGGNDGVVALGGQGGEGGNAGDVTVTNDGDTTINTSGKYSVGAMISSIGNGGGKSTSPKGAWALGANGGGGGSGSDVSVDFKSGTFKVTTEGDVADGVLISSIGGGGGHGGSTVVGLDLIKPAIGTSGGDGGSGGDISITAADGASVDIETKGFKSAGFMAQSVGGGGGAGGSVVNASIGLTFNSQTGSQKSSSGHHGGTVDIGDTDTVGLTGKVTTGGHSSVGVLIQSVGGGGGSAGTNTQAGAASIEFGHDMGTDGGAGGDGGVVTANTKTDVTTSGDHSDAVFAQSLGGGGGHASNVTDSNVGLNMSSYVGNQGSNGGTGGTGAAVTLVSDGTIQTGGDNALGVLVQSQGGGGGKGGHTIDCDIGIDAGSVKLGSSGGAGGDADDVDVTTSGSIGTKGHLSTGILAQSIAGGGGQSGTTVSGDISIDLSYTHGGDGGSGGSAGKVTLSNAADVTTAGGQALGVQAQSIGGGGGAGGVTVSGALSIAAVNIAHGADGGDGGTSGEVSLTNTGKVATTGDTSDAVSAQALGGGGGKGGLLVTGSGTGGPISGSVNVAVGGTGGKGGVGGNVDLTNSGAVTTSGYTARGLYAQSVGGSGGDGGAVISGTVNVSAEFGGSVNVAVGGDGGDSGKGGTVGITNQKGGDLTTSGHYSTGIFAQSVGGNGGVGGGSYALNTQGSGESSGEVTVTVGGSGGDGAVANKVTVENDASVTTTGGNAHGIYAQSVGGNGGVAGAGYALALDGYWKPKGESTTVDLDAAIGGSGGTAAHGDTVTVTNTGDISTKTDTSYGIYAQSVGGGGGDGGQAGSHTFGYTKKEKAPKGSDPKKSNKAVSLTYTQGGDNGASGDGGDVKVTHSDGTITTEGAASYAIFAQSVGGGGGNSGNGTPGKTGWIETVANAGEWLDDIYDTYKSVKGMPGSLLSWSIDVGGKAGSSGHGSDVSVTSSGKLHTTGDSATAIYAQSVGGGGGNAGDGSQGLITSITITHSGAGGGDGGDVSVSLKDSGSIITEGDGAMGIHAQSLGGSGGNGGDIEGNIVTAISNFAETMGAQAFGGDDGGGAGSGGDVAIAMDADSSITTSGKNAHGVWAHSVGGGGGAAGSLDTQAVATTYTTGVGSAGGDGDGGYVNADLQGDIHVTGEGAHGVFLQSASGGDSYSGGVKLYVGGSIKAEGKDARAILVQSSETGSDDPKGDWTTSGSCDQADDQCRGTSHLYVQAGAVVETTNKNAYETIAVSGGRMKMNTDGTIHYSNLIDNSGTLRSADLDSVVIANDDTGGLRIHNNDGGLLSGSLQLSDSNRTEFENKKGATFAAGSTVYLGEMGNYTGETGATLSAYGVGTIGTSQISLGGDFAESGTVLIDAESSDGATVTNDLLSFTGLEDAATVSFSDANFKPVWSGSTTYASGDKGTLQVAEVDESKRLTLSDSTVTNTSVATYTVYTKDDSSGDGAGVYVDFTVDYSGAASGVELSGNALNYASYFSDTMTSIQNGQSETLKDELSLLATEFLNTMTGEELRTAYRHYAPEEHLTGASSAISSSHALNQLLQSCPDIDPDAGLDFLHQNNCSWGMGIGSRRHQDRTSESPEFTESAWGLALGTQREVGADLFVELAGQLETLSIGGENFSQDGDRYSGGVALKKEIGRYTLSGAVTGGLYSLDYERGYTSGGVARTANADVDGRFLGAELRASAVFLGQGGFYAKPSAALAYTQVWQDGFTESGDGGLNWNVNSVSEDWLAFTPAVEVGRAFQASNRSALAFFRAGVTVALTDPTLTMSSTLVGADAPGAFNGALTSDRYQGDFAAGIEVELRDNLSISLLGQAALSENSYDYGGSARIEFRF
ncbi:autotransporter outer membrane beta-barrel domain-containing protein [Chachezhania antarctica]|uniref:autotransporter outer membrane beta-barrel domain-containing protein n=1 Tax=Chachezhania antarctica TaxID=2340860 RepID=UPI0013CE6B14|nr:autotransporter outer membrane beta-barrel domain-containing protein [Chachezhania antarctica]